MLKRNAPFLFCSVLLLCVIGFVLLNYEKAEIHLWMNTYHTSFLDFFFRYYTVIGEWVPYIVVFLLLFYKAGWATYLLSSLVISGLLSQRLKYVFDTDRPYKYFADHLPDVQLPFADGVELSKYYSFPSGHTTTFFALFLCLSIVATDYFYRTYHISKHSNKFEKVELVSIIVVSVTCFLLAAIGAYSRIYLSQHFLEDIFGGMLLGILTTLLLYLPIPRLQTTRFWDWHIRLTPSQPLQKNQINKIMNILTMLDAEEKEQLLGIWNLIPEQDRENMSQEDVLFVLDAMDDYLESVGLLKVNEETGEVTYLDGEVDETEQLNFILAAQKDRHSSSLTSSQIQIILDAELQYGIRQGYYEEED